MRINKITINNFRQYKNFELDFKNKKDYEIYSIIGQNGVGKTNILNSITWCLYNQEMHIGNENNSLILPNLDVVKNEEIGNLIKVKVEIEVEEGNQNYFFVREAKFKKNEDSVFQLENDFHVVSAESGCKNKISEKDVAKQKLNWCFPEKISEYFFFDGEKLDKYFEINTVNKIETSILEISDIKILSSISNHMEVLIKEKNREASKNNPDLEKINKNCELSEENLFREQENLSKNKIELSISEHRISKISGELKGIEDVKELEAKRDKYDGDIKNIEIQIKEKNKEIKKFIRKYTILISIFPKASMLLRKIREKKKQGQFPPNINKKLLEKTITSKTCTVCGTHLEKDGLDEIKELLSQISLSTTSSILLSSLEYPLERIIKTLKEFKSIKEKLLKELKYLHERLDYSFKEKNKIDEKLASFPDSENVKNIQQERSLLEDSNKKTRRTIVQLETFIENLKNKVKEYNEEYEKSKAKSKGLEKLNRELDLLKKSKIVIDESKEELLGEIREKVREKTEKTFLNLIWKKDTFRNIVLDKNYNLRLFNVDGYECIGSCSAAERSFLALSFTLALHDISGINAPLVIDTPISRVSDKNRENFAEVLKEVSLKKQIILLFTPSEYSEEIKSVLEPINGFKVVLETVDEKETRIGGDKW